MNPEHVEAMRETAKHIRRVQELMGQCMAALYGRAVFHDESKWSPQEWPYFAEGTARLKHLTYGSEEYRQSLEDMRPAIKHHQLLNSHHPEAHDDGIRGMTLLDLIEMLADWKAATERHVGGSLSMSLEHNTRRFEIPEPLGRVLKNTATQMGWINDEKRQAATTS